MKPNNKKINIFIKIRDTYRKVMYSESEIKELEELDKKPLKERILTKIQPYSYAFFLFIFFLIIIIFNSVNSNNSIDPNMKQGVLLNKELEGEKRQISHEEIYSYMTDSLDGTNIELKKIKLDNKISYSLTYKSNEIPTGVMVGTKYFSNGYITSVLINGYPNISYEEMNLQSEDEAYIATQLAVYQMLSEKNASMLNSDFNIDNIKACNEQYNDVVQRIIAKAKEIYSLAIENPYIEETDAIIDDSELMMKVDGDTTIVGPIVTKSITDDITKKIIGKDYNPITTVDLKSYIENTKIKIIDKDGKEEMFARNDEPFYIRIDGSDKVFAQYKISVETNYLKSKIYESKEYNNKYVVLEPDYYLYIDVFPILKGLEYGSATISLKTQINNKVEGISYYIYDENGNLIQDVDGFTSEYEFYLKTGKYFIEIYDIPDGYFIENRKHEFKVEKDEAIDVNIILDSIYN